MYANKDQESGTPSMSSQRKSVAAETPVVSSSSKAAMKTTLTNASSNFNTTKTMQNAIPLDSLKSTSLSPKETPKKGSLQMKDFRAFGPNTTPRKSRIYEVNEVSVINKSSSNILRNQYNASKNLPESSLTKISIGKMTTTKSPSPRPLLQKGNVRITNNGVSSSRPTPKSNAKITVTESLSPIPLRANVKITTMKSSSPSRVSNYKVMALKSPSTTVKKKVKSKAPALNPTHVRDANSKFKVHKSTSPSPCRSSTRTECKTTAVASSERIVHRRSQITEFHLSSSLKSPTRAGPPKPSSLGLPRVAARREDSNFLNPTIASQLKSRASRNKQRGIGASRSSYSSKSIDVSASPALFNLFMGSTSTEIHSAEGSDTSLIEVYSSLDDSESLRTAPRPKLVTTKVPQLNKLSMTNKSVRFNVDKENEPTLEVIRSIRVTLPDSDLQFAPTEVLISKPNIKETPSPSPLALFKAPVEPEITICDAFPCTTELNLYWINFHLSMDKYLNEVPEYEEGMSAFQEDIRRYTNSGEVIRSEQESSGTIDMKLSGPSKEAFPRSISYPLEGIHVLHGYVVKGQNILGTISTVTEKTTGVLVEIDLRAIDRNLILMQMEPDAIILTAGSVNRFMRIGCPEGVSASDVKISALVNGFVTMEGP